MNTKVIFQFLCAASLPSYLLYISRLVWYKVVAVNIDAGADPLSSSNALSELGKPNATGWELALVTTPSNPTSQPAQNKMVSLFIFFKKKLRLWFMLFLPWQIYSHDYWLHLSFEWRTEQTTLLISYYFLEPRTVRLLSLKLVHSSVHHVFLENPNLKSLVSPFL